MQTKYFLRLKMQIYDMIMLIVVVTVDFAEIADDTDKHE
jgi:hypothetical protein